MELTTDEITIFIKEDLDLLGYQSLRYSLFKLDNTDFTEHQIIIEYTNNLYEVYITSENRQIYGKYSFEDPFYARKKFMEFALFMVLNNRKKVEEGLPPLYPCSIWDK